MIHNDRNDRAATYPLEQGGSMQAVESAGFDHQSNSYSRSSGSKGTRVDRYIARAGAAAVLLAPYIAASAKHRKALAWLVAITGVVAAGSSVLRKSDG